MPKPLDQAAPSKVNTLRRQPHHVLPLTIPGEPGRFLEMTKAATMSVVGDVKIGAEFLAGGVWAWLETIGSRAEWQQQQQQQNDLCGSSSWFLCGSSSSSSRMIPMLAEGARRTNIELLARARACVCPACISFA